MEASPDQSSCHLDMDRPLSVLDLPAAWLVQTIWYLDRASRLSLFCTCKGLKDLVMGSADSTSLQLQPLNMDQDKMLKALELAHQGARRIALLIHHEQQHDEMDRCWHGQVDVWYQHARLLAHRSCSLLHQAQLLSYLQTVARLEITAMDLVAPWMWTVFKESCPNLTALSLRFCNITWVDGATRDSLSTGFHHLQELSLCNVKCERPSQACLTWLQQQVAQLTSLKSLRLTTDAGDRCTSLYAAIAESLTPTVAGQLVHVELPWWRPPPRATCQLNISQFTSLQGLGLEGVVLDDALMQQLLSLPNLTSVSVLSIRVQQSYRGQACHWQQLAVTWLRLEDFARLPLHTNFRLQAQKGKSATWLKFHDRNTTTHTHEDLDNINKALDNIKTSKWGGWDGARLGLIYWDDHLQQALPLLNGVGKLVLSAMMLSEKLTMTLAEHVASQQKAFALELESCGWQLAPMTKLVSLLPAGSSLVVRQVEEPVVIHLCWAAQHRFALHAISMWGLQAGAKERVEKALACKGVYLQEYDTQFRTAPSLPGIPLKNWVVIVNGCHNAAAVSSAPNSDSQKWAALLRGHQ